MSMGRRLVQWAAIIVAVPVAAYVAHVVIYYWHKSQFFQDSL